MFTGNNNGRLQAVVKDEAESRRVSVEFEVPG
jgi:hypothetical protein